MDYLDLTFKIFTALGSLIAFLLAYLQIRERRPRVKFKAFQNIVALPVRRDEYGGYVHAEVPAISFDLVNHGIITIYPKEIVVLVNKHHQIKTHIYYRDNSGGTLKFPPLERDRSSLLAIYGQHIWEQLGLDLQSAKKISLQVICFCENETSYKSNKVATDPTSLQPKLWNP